MAESSITTKEHLYFMQRAIQIAQIGMKKNAGGPFGCVIVKNNKIIAEAHNEVLCSLDPTAHAEITAIRIACKNLNSFQLEDCIVYTSCEPCPMCLGAIYWARPQKVFYALTKTDAKSAGFDDAFIYEELKQESINRSIPFEQVGADEAKGLFEDWLKKTDKTSY